MQGVNDCHNFPVNTSPLPIVRYCSIYVHMSRIASHGSWNPPPACVEAARLRSLPTGAVVAVAGLVLVRQRPGTAKGVVFLTLEDETGVANIVVWAKTFERFRREVTAGRLLRVTGKIQNEEGVVHVIAGMIEDISNLLDELVSQTAAALADHASESARNSGRATSRAR